MKPKEKAIKLVSRFYRVITGIREDVIVEGWYYTLSNSGDKSVIEAKKCALICVAEIKESFGELEWLEKLRVYWRNVETEINNL